MTLDGQKDTLVEIKQFYRATQKIATKIDPYYQRQNIGYMILVSRNIRYKKQIIVGVLRGGGIKYNNCYTCVQTFI